MSIKFLDSFSYIQDNIGYLNDDEYAYSAGSKIVVRPFKSSDNKELKYLEYIIFIIIFVILNLKK